MARDRGSGPTGAEPRRARIVALALGVSVAAVAFGAQALTVHHNYGGNWTGLFNHGELFPFPEELRSEGVYFFPDSHGYDGQIYHVIAHDPFLKRGFARQVDDPRLRYRRILLPVLAHALGRGSPATLHAAYLGLVLLSTALGAAGLALWAIRHGRNAAWAALFLLTPATFVSLDRLTADVALAALCVVFVICVPGRRMTPLVLVVVLASFVRETGLLLWTALVAAALVQRDWRRGAVLLPTVLPALAWYAFVSARTPALPYPSSYVPLEGMARAFLDPPVRGPAPPESEGVTPLRAYWRSVAPTVASTLVRVALLGALCAFGLGLGLLRKPGDPVHLLGAMFAALGLFLQRSDNWVSVYDFGRVYSPLLVVLAMRALERRSLCCLLPTALMAPSMMLQTSRQLSGILRGIF